MNLPGIAGIFKTGIPFPGDTECMRNDVFADTETTLEQARDAFSSLRPVRDDYPHLPIEEGFNWEECAAGLSISSLYLVVFRSVRRADADLATLKAYDDRAFEDAQQAPGFLFYFKGQVTPERACLSFCLWGTREQARSASVRADHVAASNLVAQMYETYELERHTLRHQNGMLVFDRLVG
jgi:hypothetical protein